MDTPEIGVIDLSGPPRARGRQAGADMAVGVRSLLQAWIGSLAPLGGEDYARALLRETDFRAAIGEHCPDLLDEMRGLADGAGLDPDLVFALQLMDEEWAFRARRRGEPTPEKCSSFAIVRPEGPTWIGQNMDLGVYTDGHQVMLRIAAHGDHPAALLLSVTGMIGLLGVNAAGVAVCVNSLPQLPSAPRGVPVAFMIRKLLQARTLAEAVGWVTTLPHATNQHYLLADSRGVRSFECSAAGATEYHPPDPTRVFHTNHPLSPEQGRPESDLERLNSLRRLESLTGRLAAGAPDLEDLQAALCAFDDPTHPVCRVFDPGAGLIGFTTGSMISQLPRDGSAPRSWASPGPPSRSGYTALTLAQAA